MATSAAVTGGIEIPVLIPPIELICGVDIWWLAICG